MKEEVSDDLVKNVKRQAGSRAALTACLFTPGMEGGFCEWRTYENLVREWRRKYTRSTLL